MGLLDFLGYRPSIMDAIIIVECDKCEETFAWPDYDIARLYNMSIAELLEKCGRCSTCDTDLTYLEHQQMCG